MSSVPLPLISMKSTGRDSSVGRASDWRSEGPWFNPGSRHKRFYLFYTRFRTYRVRLLDRFSSKVPSFLSFLKLYPISTLLPWLWASYSTLAKTFVRSGIRTHAHIRGPERSTRKASKDMNLESGALDHSAILTNSLNQWFFKSLVNNYIYYTYLYFICFVQSCLLIKLSSLYTIAYTHCPLLTQNALPVNKSKN